MPADFKSALHRGRSLVYNHPAGREARKEKITMEKSVIPCGASPQEWRYIDALGADARYIVPIVSNPDLPGVGSLSFTISWSLLKLMSFD